MPDVATMHFGGALIAIVAGVGVTALMRCCSIGVRVAVAGVGQAAQAQED